MAQDGGREKPLTQKEIDRLSRYAKSANAAAEATRQMGEADRQAYQAAEASDSNDVGKVWGKILEKNFREMKERNAQSAAQQAVVTEQPTTLPEFDVDEPEISDDLPKKEPPFQFVRQLAARLRFMAGGKREDSGKPKEYVNPNLITEYTNVSPEVMQEYVRSTADLLLRIPEEYREQVIHVLLVSADGGSVAVPDTRDPKVREFDQRFREFLQLSSLEGRIAYEYKKDGGVGKYDVVQRFKKGLPVVDQSTDKITQDINRNRAKSYLKNIPDYQYEDVQGKYYQHDDERKDQYKGKNMTDEMFKALDAANANIDWTQPGYQMEGARPGSDAMVYGFNMSGEYASDDNPDERHTYADELPAFKKLITDIVETAAQTKAERVHNIREKLEDQVSLMDQNLVSDYLLACQNTFQTGQTELSKYQVNKLGRHFEEMTRTINDQLNEKISLQKVVRVQYSGDKKYNQNREKGYLMVTDQRAAEKFLEYFSAAIGEEGIQVETQPVASTPVENTSANVDAVDAQKLDLLEGELRKILSKLDEESEAKFIQAFGFALENGGAELDQDDAKMMTTPFIETMKLMKSILGIPGELRDIGSIYPKGQAKFGQREDMGYIVMKNPEVAQLFSEYFVAVLNKVGYFGNSSSEADTSVKKKDKLEAKKKSEQTEQLDPQKLETIREGLEKIFYSEDPTTADVFIEAFEQALIHGDAELPLELSGENNKYIRRMFNEVMSLMTTTLAKERSYHSLAKLARGQKYLNQREDRDYIVMKDIFTAKEFSKYFSAVLDQEPQLDAEDQKKLKKLYENLKKLLSPVEEEVRDRFLVALDQALNTGIVEISQEDARKFVPLFTKVINLLKTAAGINIGNQEIGRVYTQGQSRFEQDPNKGYIVIENEDIAKTFLSYIKAMFAAIDN